MTVLRSRIEITKKSGTNDFSWEGSASEVNYVAGSLECIDNIGAAMDTFKFSISNPNGSLFATSSLIDVGDKVKVYQWTGTGNYNTSSDIIDEYIVEELVKSVENKRWVDVRGKSFINALFNTQVFMDTSGINVVQATQDVLAKVNLKMGASTSRWVYGQNSAEWTAIGNPTGGGSAGNQTYPTFTFVRKHTTAIDLLLELWSDKFTSDGQYMLYVSFDAALNRYPFRVTRKSNLVTGSITESSNERRWIIREKIDDVVNIVTYNCGHDAYGNPMEFFHYDVTSMQKYGPREKYWTDTQELGRSLMSNEQKSNPSSFPTDASGEFTSNFPSSFPYTMSFNTRSDTGDVGAGVWSVGSSASYNSAIRKEVKWEGRKQVEAYIAQRTAPRKELDTSVPRSQAQYGLTNLYQVVSPSYGYTGSNMLNLRLVKKTYRDWTIDYDFQEDEEN